MFSLRRMIRNIFRTQNGRSKPKELGRNWEGSLENRQLMASSLTSTAPVTRLISIEDRFVGPIRLAVATFSGPLNRVSAVSSRNYRIVLAGGDGVFRTRDDISLPVTVSRMNARSVFITPRARLNPDVPILVCVRQGLKDKQGQRVDNDNDGRPGGNACVILRGDPLGGPNSRLTANSNSSSGHWRTVRPIR